MKIGLNPSHAATVTFPFLPNLRATNCELTSFGALKGDFHIGGLAPEEELEEAHLVGAVNRPGEDGKENAADGVELSGQDVDIGGVEWYDVSLDDFPEGVAF